MNGMFDVCGPSSPGGAGYGSSGMFDGDRGPNNPGDAVYGSSGMFLGVRGPNSPSSDSDGDIASSRDGRVTGSGNRKCWPSTGTVSGVITPHHPSSIKFELGGDTSGGGILHMLGGIGRAHV